MTPRRETTVRMIPIDAITVVNERSRGQTRFRQIVTNISNIGLKKPITVARRKGPGGEDRYDLVCGQGRLEAFQSLGQKMVPALVIEAGPDDLLLMSLAENLARKQRTTIEFAREIVALHDRGYGMPQIAAKVDLDVTYVRGIVRLLKHGEERLLHAVENRQIPLSMAIEIAESDDEEVRRMMADAYEKKELRGRALLMARRLIDRRKNKGKALYQRGTKVGGLPAESLVNVYKKEVGRMRLLVTRAESAEAKLQFVATAFRKLLADPEFLPLLKAESLGQVPRFLMDQLNEKENPNARQGRAGVPPRRNHAVGGKDPSPEAPAKGHRKQQAVSADPRVAPGGRAH